MTDEEAFLQAILRAPADDTARLVYADWLEERGDPLSLRRAECLRVKCERDALPAGDRSRWQRLHDRFCELRAAVGDGWWWQAGCSSPSNLLSHLGRRVGEADIVRFNVACCRRVWHLITDSRSRAVVEAAARWADGGITAEELRRVYDEWSRAYRAGAVSDLAGGRTHGAIISVPFGWDRYAAALARDCSESVGYAASEPLRRAGAPEPEIAAAWRAAADAETAEQCRLLRELFGHLTGTD